jgi:signal transduction histidine kinase
VLPQDPGAGSPRHGPGSVAALARDWSSASVGVLAGAATAWLDLGFAVVAGAAWLLTRIPGPHRRPIGSVVASWAVAVTAVELRRIVRFHGPVHTDPLEPGRSAWYLVLRSAVGLLGAGVVLLLLQCLVVAGSMVSAWLLDGGWSLISTDDHVDTALIAIVTPPGILLIFLTVVGVSGVGSLDRLVAQRMLGRATDRFLRARVEELTSSRDEVVDAVDEERRRIERDLHDGVQQHLVTLGMLLGRARRAERPEQLGDLLTRAHEVSKEAISDLRDVANRVYPIALDKDGLQVALELLAERAGVRVRLDYRLTGRLRPVVETTIYFVVAEAVTNATKHACPSHVEVAVTRQEFDRVLTVVTDDGCGGADPSGSGLSGLARRAGAVDGTLTVQSPVGGPTTVAMSVPCG